MIALSAHTNKSASSGNATVRKIAAKIAVNNQPIAFCIIHFLVEERGVFIYITCVIQMQAQA